MFDDFFNFWNIWAIASAVILLVFVLEAIVVSKKRYKRKRLLSPYRGLCVGVLLSAFFFVYPIYFLKNNEMGIVLNVIHCFFVSAQHSIRLFVMDGAASDITGLLDGMENIPMLAYRIYSVIGSFLYFFAPLLTFGFILSFFKNLSSYVKYRLSLRKNIHIFSELNDKSLALATSISKQDEGKVFKKNLIIFADFLDKYEEEHLDWTEDALELGAIFFRKDLDSIKLKKWCCHSVYLISEDESEKIRHAKDLIKNYGSRSEEKMKLYIFSDSEESKCFLESYSDVQKKSIQMRVERINDIRFLIYHYLDLHGVELFQHAAEKDGIREISVAVVGLGKYGMEIVKALLWFCQMPGYRIKITAFDKDKNADSRIRTMFPALGDNHVDVMCDLSVKQGIEVGTEIFETTFDAIASDLTHVFVTLGSDAENLSASLYIRRLLARKDDQTDITTVIYDSDLKDHVDCAWRDEDCKIKGSSMMAYKIHVIGDVKSFYAVDTIIDPHLVSEGKQLNDSWKFTEDTWGIETEDIKLNRKVFYMHDYNFYSSVSRALHLSLRNRMIGDHINFKTVFPKLYSEESDHTGSGHSMEYWRHFVIQNTLDAKGAFMLKTGLDKMLEALPEELKKIFKQHTAYSDESAVIQKYHDKRFSLSFGENEARKEYKLSITDVIELVHAAAEIEHVRWNAYMLTEGFVFVKGKEKKSTEYRRHNNLVPVSELSLFDCIKDV